MREVQKVTWSNHPILDQRLMGALNNQANGMFIWSVECSSNVVTNAWSQDFAGASYRSRFSVTQIERCNTQNIPKRSWRNWNVPPLLQVKKSSTSYTTISSNEILHQAMMPKHTRRTHAVISARRGFQHAGMDVIIKESYRLYTSK